MYTTLTMDDIDGGKTIHEVTSRLLSACSLEMPKQWQLCRYPPFARSASALQYGQGRAVPVPCHYRGTESVTRTTIRSISQWPLL